MIGSLRERQIRKEKKRSERTSGCLGLIPRRGGKNVGQNVGGKDIEREFVRI
jgi:hypothetical protein